eukprot:2879842-Rhodomonas_salina.1
MEIPDDVLRDLRLIFTRLKLDEDKAITDFREIVKKHTKKPDKYPGVEAKAVRQEARGIFYAELKLSTQGKNLSRIEMSKLFTNLPSVEKNRRLNDAYMSLKPKEGGEEVRTCSAEAKKHIGNEDSEDEKEFDKYLQMRKKMQQMGFHVDSDMPGGGL